MTKVHHYVALSAGPTGLRGVCATTRDGKAFAFESKRDLTWSDAGPDLSAQSSAIAQFVRELAGTRRSSARGVLLIHPAWSYADRVAIPPAGNEEVRAFLQLWVDRHWSPVSPRGVRWDWSALPTTESRHEALVVMARPETLEPLEQAFAATGIAPRFCTVVPLAQALSMNGLGADSLLVQVEPAGVVLAEFHDGTGTGFSWVSSGIDASAEAGLLQYHLTDRLAHHDAARLLLCGSDSQPQVAALPALQRAEPVAWTAATADGHFATDATDAALLGGLRLAAQTAKVHPNLAAKSVATKWGRRRRELLASPRRVAAVAALLIFGLVATVVGGNAWRDSAMEDARKAAAAIRIDEDAVQSNVDILRAHDRDRRSVLDLLLAINEAKPAAVMLLGVDIDRRGNVVINGQTQNVGNVEELTAKINAGKAFAGAVTQDTRLQNDQVTFTIRCRVRR